MTGSQNDIGSSEAAHFTLRVSGSGIDEPPIELDIAKLKTQAGLVVGRSDDKANITIKSGSISRAHVRFSIDNNETLLVDDLGSKNGTFVDGSRLDVGIPVVLSDGSEVQLGTIKLILERSKIANTDSSLTNKPPEVLSSTATLLLRSAGGALQRKTLTLQMLENGVTIGRSESKSEIVIIDPSVSGLHCKLTADKDGNFEISDLGSRNGTFVDGRKLDAEPTRIYESSTVEIGAALLKVTPFEENANQTVVSEYQTFISQDATIIASSPKFTEDATIISGSSSLNEPQKIDSEQTQISAVNKDENNRGSTQDIGQGVLMVEGLQSTPEHHFLKNKTAPPTAMKRRLLSFLTSAMIVTILITVTVAIVLGPAQYAAQLSQFLTVLLVLSVSLWAMTGLKDEWQRRRQSRAFWNIENDRLRLEVGILTAQHKAEVRNLAGNWSGFRKFRVRRKQMEGGDICSFYLVAHDERPICGFQPGQHITFQLKPESSDKSVIRCYTLSDNITQTDYYRVSIKRVPPPHNKPDVPPGLSSNYFHDHISEGDILDIKAPSGKFFLDTKSGSPVVLIGGGIGLTPILSMVNEIAATGSSRETWVFYGVRNRDEHIMKEHLEQLASQHPNIHLNICYSEPREGMDRLVADFQHAERVSVDLFKRLLPSNNYDFLMCGPPQMMETLVDDLEAWGVPESNIHLEAFGPASLKKCQLPAPTETAGAKAINISFSKSGETLPWKPDSGNILGFAESNGIRMESGCRAGSCGSCLCAVKSGRVRYIEEPGNPLVSGSCYTCIAVPDGDLELEA